MTVLSSSSTRCTLVREHCLAAGSIQGTAGQAALSDYNDHDDHGTTTTTTTTTDQLCSLSVSVCACPSALITWLPVTTVSARPPEYSSSPPPPLLLFSKNHNRTLLWRYTGSHVFCPQHTVFSFSFSPLCLHVQAYFLLLLFLLQANGVWFVFFLLNPFIHPFVPKHLNLFFKTLFIFLSFLWYKHSTQHNFTTEPLFINSRKLMHQLSLWSASLCMPLFSTDIYFHLVNHGLPSVERLLFISW